MNKWVNVKDGLPPEEESVLVLQDGCGTSDYLIVQAQIFQGQWYPDHLFSNIDFEDSIQVEWWTENIKPPL